jgi:hypothetical protein
MTRAGEAPKPTIRQRPQAEGNDVGKPRVAQARFRSEQLAQQKAARCREALASFQTP